MRDLELLTGRLSRDGEEIYWELVRDADEGNSDTRPVVVLSHGAGGSHAVWSVSYTHLTLPTKA